MAAPRGVSDQDEPSAGATPVVVGAPAQPSYRVRILSTGMSGMLAAGRVPNRWATLVPATCVQPGPRAMNCPTHCRAARVEP